MTAALVHRGPDGEGYYQDDHVALGHRRLSIIDLAGGAQPISNETGTLQLICNGEIYNSPQLRRELEGRGHRFKTHTDVEVILHLYEEHGRDCVRYLRGMFAFAIWDAPQRRLVLARDHLGQKPLYFASTDDTLLFASEPKAILATGLVRPRLHLDALWHYISLRYLPDRYSLFVGIEKLPAGHTAIWDGRRMDLHHYWRPNYRYKHDRSVEAIEEELDALLRETVAGHMLSDVRVGALLSGGIDSSTIAAMMALQSAGPVPSFSIGVKEQGFNELPYARMVAERYGLEAHEEVVRADLVHLIPRMIHYMDEPADPFGVGVYLVAGVASRHVKVVLGGDGGDENFAGYDRYAGQRLAEVYALLPEGFRRQVMGRLVERIPESFGYKSFAQKARWLNEMSFYGRGERYARSLSFLRFTPEQKESLFTADARAQIQDDDSVVKILRYFDADNVESLVDRMLYTDLMTRMPDHLLAIVDRMSMAQSLESRSPLIDHEVVSYAAAIPAHFKLHGRKLKYILRRVAARYLPSALIYRKKQGFGFPLGLWMRGELREFLTRLFDESRFVDAGIFRREAVQQVLDEHLDGRVDHNFRIWILMNLEFWYRLYLEGESMEALRDDTDRLMRG